MGHTYQRVNLHEIFPCLTRLENLSKNISLEEYEKGDSAKSGVNRVCDYISFNKLLKQTVKEVTSNGTRRNKRKLWGV